MNQSYHCQLPSSKFVSILRSTYGSQNDAMLSAYKIADTSNEVQELFTQSKTISSETDVDHSDTVSSIKLENDEDLSINVFPSHSTSCSSSTNTDKISANKDSSKILCHSKFHCLEKEIVCNKGERRSDEENRANIDYIITKKEVIEEPLFSNSIIMSQLSGCQNYENLNNTDLSSEENNIQHSLPSKPMAFMTSAQAVESSKVSVTKSEENCDSVSSTKMDVFTTSSSDASHAYVESCQTVIQEMNYSPTAASNFNTDVSEKSRILNKSGSGVNSYEGSMSSHISQLEKLTNSINCSKSLRTDIGSSSVMFPEQSENQACVQVCSANASHNLVLLRNCNSFNPLNSVNGLLVLNSNPFILGQPEANGQNPEILQPGQMTTEATGSISKAFTSGVPFLSSNNFVLPNASQTLSDSNNFVLLPVPNSSTNFSGTYSSSSSSEFRDSINYSCSHSSSLFSTNTTSKTDEQIFVPSVSQQSCVSLSNSNPLSSLSLTQATPMVCNVSSEHFSPPQADGDLSNILNSDQSLQSATQEQKSQLPYSFTAMTPPMLILLPKANVNHTQRHTQSLLSLPSPQFVSYTANTCHQSPSSLIQNNPNVNDVASSSVRVSLNTPTEENAEHGPDIDLETTESDILKQSNEALADLLKPLYKFMENKKCLLCGFESKAKYDYAVKQHLLVHLDKRVFRCNVCDKMFLSQKALFSHRSIHSTEYPFACDICGRKFRVRGTMHSHKKRTHSKKEKYQCVLCEKSFTKRLALKYHLRIHTGERPYMCPTCLKTFRTPGLLRNHSVKHGAAKPHMCLHCSKTFSNRTNMKDHMRLHDENSSKYKCDECDKTFTFRSNLCQHKFTHSNKRNHSCPICDMKFKLAHHLKAHILTHKSK